MNADSSLCPTHGTSYNPNGCYDCVLAELARISQREGALLARGYDAANAHRLASTWAKCRRHNQPYPPDVQVARTLLEKQLFNQ